MKCSFAFAIGLLFVGLICLSQSNAYWQSREQILVGVVTPAYVFKACGTANGVGDSITISVDIGTASADRLIVVGSGSQNTPSFTSMVANGITLNTDVNVAGTASRITLSSGLVTSGSGAQNIVGTWASSGFFIRSLCVWTLTGLNSNLIKNSGSNTGSNGTASINVTAGDFMFAFASSGGVATPDFSTSTEAPVASHSVGVGIVMTGADWTIVSTNASFSVIGTNTNSIVAGTYR